MRTRVLLLGAFFVGMSVVNVSSMTTFKVIENLGLKITTLDQQPLILALGMDLKPHATCLCGTLILPL